MNVEPFKLERYFAKYEFSAPYMLSSSDCEPLTLKELLSLADRESLELWDGLWLGYTESQGHPVLREEIAKFYKNIKPENVIEVVPEEGIYMVMQVLLEKGDHVICTFPGYQTLYDVASSIGCEVTKLELIQEKNWLYDLELVKKSIKSNTKLIIFNFPHNPTGAIISQSDLETLIKIAREKNIYVFSDEMYRFLEYDEKDRLESACDLYENAISLFGMSKTFGLAGLRVGWLTTQNEKSFKKLVTFKDYTTICGSAPSEVLSIIALRVKDKIIDRNLKIIKSNLKLLDDFFSKNGDKFHWNRPKAGSIAFPNLLLDKDVNDFCLDLVEKKGVMLLPASVYDYKGNNFRIGFGRRNMPEALSLFEKYLSDTV